MFPWGLKHWICSEKSALCIHANSSIWPMQGGILPLRNGELIFWTAVNFEVEYFLNEETEGVLTDTMMFL